MKEDNYSMHMAWIIKKLTTDIAINDSTIHAIREIQDLWRSGVLTDAEYIEISNRIGW